MFQKRHYEAFADMMQTLHPGPMSATNRAVMQWHDTREALCRLFEQSSQRFDRPRFERACEPGANVRGKNAGKIVSRAATGTTLRPE